MSQTGEMITPLFESCDGQKPPSAPAFFPPLSSQGEDGTFILQRGSRRRLRESWRKAFDAPSHGCSGAKGPLWMTLPMASQSGSPGKTGDEVVTPHSTPTGRLRLLHQFWSETARFSVNVIRVASSSVTSAEGECSPWTPVSLRAGPT